MTSDEWQKFKDRLLGHYGAKLTREQLETWKASVLRLKYATADQAFTNYYIGDKKASDGPQPALSGFMRHVGKLIGKAKAKGHKPGMWDAERDRVRRDETTRVNIDSFTDEDMGICLAAMNYYRATYSYGPYTSSAVSIWNRWQQLLKWAGYESNHWSSDQDGDLQKRYVEIMGTDLSSKRSQPKTWVQVLEDHETVKALNANR